MTEMLEQERDYYDAHLQEWLQHMAGRFVLIKNADLVGTYDTVEDAITDGAHRFGLQSYLVRRVEQQQEAVSAPALMLGLLNARFQRPAHGPSAAAGR